MLPKKTNLLMVLVMLVFGAVSLRYAEKLPVGGGFGWDGVNYGTWAKDFHKSIFVDKVSHYFVQRIAPSAIVHYSARALLFPFYSGEQIQGILAKNENIILLFGICNLVLLLIAVYVWGLTADSLNLTDKGKWFGFCCLFVNYAIAKSNFYQPVLTDTSAFLLGILMFYFFLTNKSWGLFGVMLVGAFTWPTIPITSALLLSFPRTNDQSRTNRFTATAVRNLSLLVSLVACAFAWWMFADLLRQKLPQQWDQASMARIDFHCLYLSIAAVVVFLFFGFRVAFADSRLFDFRYLLKAVHWRWAIVCLLTLVALQFIVHQLGKPVPNPPDFRSFITILFVSSLTEPFIFVVSHAVYYGPAILLIFILWKPFCEYAGHLGIGFRLFVILNVFLAICPQSRYQIPAVSAFVIVLVAVVDRPLLSRWNLAFWLLLSLFYSKVWYTFNTGPMLPDETMASLLRFPLQHFFMNSGPWMSHSMYLAQGWIVLGTGIALYGIVNRESLERSISATRVSDTD